MKYLLPLLALFALAQAGWAKPGIIPLSSSGPVTVDKLWSRENPVPVCGSTATIETNEYLWIWEPWNIIWNYSDADTEFYEVRESTSFACYNGFGAYVGTWRKFEKVPREMTCNADMFEMYGNPIEICLRSDGVVLWMHTPIK